MTQKTLDEMAEAWAQEIESSDALAARLAALEARLVEYEAVIGALCRRGPIKLRRDEILSAPKFDTAVEDSVLVLRQR